MKRIKIRLRRRTRYERLRDAAARVRKIAADVPLPESPGDVLAFCSASAALRPVVDLLDERGIELRLVLDVGWCGAEVEYLAEQRLRALPGQTLEPWVITDAACGTEYAGTPCD